MLPYTLMTFAVECKKNFNFLGMEPWYKYINDSDHFKGCEIKNFNLLPPKSDVPLVLLAIVDDLLRIAGIVAVAFVIYGGIRLITSEGNPESSSKARETILNALIGLVIAIVAIAFVSFIGNKLS